ncbi:hypothetical protein FHT44_006138 [Mycolicibacterium sp. BK634]|uniref:hypothetical protein n=1 Tax=Mycolicibacterium sp. BK634 TaxID=2587099 RepID=UPI001617D76F|nr:hypothetical protein [Mycolicibacterium sp. BK634]MBB3753616.1 hypothetical protein [Mycolicibacterium sp. BK634]
MSASDDYWDEEDVLGESEPASTRHVMLTKFPGVLPQWLTAIVAPRLQELRSSIDTAAEFIFSAELVQSFLGGGDGSTDHGDDFDEADRELAQPYGVQIDAQKDD